MLLRRFGWAVLLAVATIWPASGPAAAADRRGDKSALTVMTLNAEFLWDGVVPEEGGATFDWKGDKAKAEEHMAAVAAIIKASNPDIVNLAEVENLAALKRLNDGFLAGQGYEPYFVQGTDTGTGQDVTLLTRIDPESGGIQRDKRAATSGGATHSVSKNYYAKLKVGDQQIALVGLHLRAFPDRQDLKPVREAQAKVIAQLATDLTLQGYSVVVMGDFNDFDGSPECLDAASDVPITAVLSTIRAVQPSTASDDLTNASRSVAQTDRYTYVYSGRHQAIDHVLLSPPLALAVTSVTIPHDHDLAQHPDHYAVVVKISTATLPTTGAVHILRVLPNPVGDDRDNEKATIQNTGSTAVSVLGWKLRDESGAVWALDGLGTLMPGEIKTIKRNGKAMSMNNQGDTIELLEPSGTVVDQLSYGPTEEGVWVEAES
jgi:endonuclease/exonuclease/phosphatase family metal-dependent hydrolase